MSIVDYHLHTSLCGHATGEIREYTERAAQLGIGEIGFSDHLPLYFLPPGKSIPGYAMAEEELPVYVTAVETCKRNSPLKVKLGIEADFVPGHEEKLALLLASYPFDYIIGSVHFIGDWGFDNAAEIEEYSKRDIDRVYDEYFTLLQQAALSGLFDIMAHPDLIKKFNFRATRDVKLLYEDTARAFKKAGVCVEVNTAGLRVPAKEIYPSLELLKLFFKYGVPATLGSDAHCPEQVGSGLKLGVQLLKAVGYTRIALFEGRRRAFLEV